MEAEARIKQLQMVIGQVVSLSAQEWEAGSELFRPRDFELGEALIETGESGTELFFLNAGLVRCHLTHYRVIPGILHLVLV